MTNPKWNAVQNALDYETTCEVYQNGYEIMAFGDIVNTNSSDMESCIDSIVRDFGVTDGLITLVFAVKARSWEGKYVFSDFSSFSTELTYNLTTHQPIGTVIENQLATPNGLQWDNTIARWNPVEHAVSYHIY